MRPPPLLQALGRIVLVDNQLTRRHGRARPVLADEHGSTGHVVVHKYLFDSSRCGPKHLNTPGDSVHSLTHFYNWSFSHVRSRYSLKWDGDMVLTPEGSAMLADTAWRIESEQVGYFDVGLRNAEPWFHPQGPDYVYVKAPTG